MSLLKHPRREEIAAALMALVFVSVGALMWSRGGSGDGASDADRPRRALGTPLPKDTERAAGKLPNGMQYFVRVNPIPKHRAELRLVVNAGAVLEDDDQRGLAHAVEHMVFRGTRHFPGRTIESYFSSLGMRDGEDINATTNQDETVYTATVPTDRPEALDSALTMLADMAHEATFDPVEARTEAGIVLGEWRSDRTARERFGEVRDSTIMAGSRYGTRRTIGDTSVLRRFDVGAMRRFYRAWYRPELMAVVVVGDISEMQVVAKVKKLFGTIPASEKRVVRPEIPAPIPRTLRSATLTDPEAVGTRLSLWFPQPSRALRTLGDYRASLVGRLWREVLDARLEEATDRPGSPLLGANVTWRGVNRPVDANVVSAIVVEGSTLPAVDLLVDEMNHLAQHGPTESELRRQVQSILRSRNDAAQWSDESSDLADAYATEFLTGEAPIDRDASLALAEELLPTITARDLRESARLASLDSGAFVLITAPARDVHTRVSPAELIARVRAASSHAVTRTRETQDSVDLMPVMPKPGRIATEKVLTDFQTFDWTLENGMRVILKPTDFADEQVEFRLFGSGGASLASDADYPSAYLSDGIVRSTGVGSLSGRRLGQFIDASSIDLTQHVGDGMIEINGYVGSRDVETLLQLLRLHFTAARADTAAFRRYLDRAKSFAVQRGADPDAVFDDSVAAAVTQHHPRALHNGERFMASLDLAKSLRFWNARMSSAASFTLVLTGDFTLEQVRPLVERYLASLPGGVREQPRDRGVRFPDGVVRRTVLFGTGPKARTQLVFSGPFDMTDAASDALSAARDVAARALSERLRETLGGTYGVHVWTGVELAPSSTYRMMVDFEAAPERIDSLTDAALAVLARLRTAGPTRAELERTRAAETADIEDNLDDNDFWADELALHARAGLPLTSISEHQRNAKELNAARLRDACGRYFAADHYVRVTMYPKSAPRHESVPDVHARR
jgi:zinc protease